MTNVKGQAKGHNLVDMVDEVIAKAKAEPQNLTAHERDIALGSGEFDNPKAPAIVKEILTLVRHYEDGLITATTLVEGCTHAIVTNR